MCVCSGLDSRNVEPRESLEYQTAISDVLVMTAVDLRSRSQCCRPCSETANRLCRARWPASSSSRTVRSAESGLRASPEYQQAEASTPILPGPGTLVGRVARPARRSAPKMPRPILTTCRLADARIQNVRSACR